MSELQTSPPGFNSPLTPFLLYSADAKKASKSSYKRRKDQNSEISELEALLPWSQKGAGIDKISVLRLTATFLKFREFWATCKLRIVIGHCNDV